MVSNFLLSLITIPTQINSGINALLDNNNLHPDIKNGNMSITISDHVPSFMIVHKINITFRKYKNFDREHFVLDYFEIDCNNTIEIDKEDVNQSISEFIKQINVLLDKYMPLKKLSQKEFKRKYKAWITDKILRKIVIKYRILKKSLNVKTLTKNRNLCSIKTFKERNYIVT